MNDITPIDPAPRKFDVAATPFSMPLAGVTLEGVFSLGARQWRKSFKQYGFISIINPDSSSPIAALDIKFGDGGYLGVSIFPRNDVSLDYKGQGLFRGIVDKALLQAEYKTAKHPMLGQILSQSHQAYLAEKIGIKHLPYYGLRVSEIPRREYIEKTPSLMELLDSPLLSQDPKIHESIRIFFDRIEQGMLQQMMGTETSRQLPKEPGQPGQGRQ